LPETVKNGAFGWRFMGTGSTWGIVPVFYKKSKGKKVGFWLLFISLLDTIPECGTGRHGETSKLAHAFFPFNTLPAIKKTNKNSSNYRL